MFASVIICLTSLAVLVWWLRREKASLAIPIAYLFALLFIHVPGAIAHMVGGDYLADTAATEIGIRYTAIGAVAFVVGVVYEMHGREVAYGAAAAMMLVLLTVGIALTGSAWSSTGSGRGRPPIPESRTADVLPSA